jgi:hypothetical protein
LTDNVLHKKMTDTNKGISHFFYLSKGINYKINFSEF